MTAKVDAKSARWISREFSELVVEAQENRDLVIDLLIVGSGYGGGIAAATLAGCEEHGRPQRVVILERGREYLPGMFPSRMADLATQVRGSGLNKARGGEGLFDIRAGGNVNVVLANGLGGGSLINAGVMEIPKHEVFDLRWPSSMQGRAGLDPFYERARRLLGAADERGLNTISRHASVTHDPLKKTEALRRMSPGRFREAAITVATQDKVTTGRVALDACKLCGDCATGCNYNAKESVDTNLLAAAFQRDAQIYCGGTVLKLLRDGDCWSVRAAYTDPKLQTRQGDPITLKARKVILAAGTLGSTEILQRSAADPQGPRLSRQLGQRFSGNGDMIAFGYGYRGAGKSNAIADETRPPASRRVGPTITGVLDVTLPVERAHPGSDPPAKIGQHIVIEELAVPGPLRRLAEQSIATVKVLHSLEQCDWSFHGDGYPRDDAFAIHPQTVSDMAIFAAMGDDGACGELAWTGSIEDEDDGHVEPRWPDDAEVDVAISQAAMIEQLAKKAGFGGRTIANPLWRLLPASMSFLVDGQRGSIGSVHPLGGCAMGESAGQGVVDEFGQVYDGIGGGHPDLIVLDGAIIPSALQTNPALTIAAIALRASEHWKEKWGWQSRAMAPTPIARRPFVEDAEKEIIERPAPATVAEFSERLAEAVVLHDAAGNGHRCWVEITLTYDSVRLDQLLAPDADGRLVNATLRVPPDAGVDRGRLRIFREEDWRAYQSECLQHDQPMQRRALEQRAIVYEISGSLRVLLRERSNALSRVGRSAWAWFWNRGWRDLHVSPPLPAREKIRRVIGLVKLASRAGEVRRFEYALDIGAERQPGDEGLAFLRGLTGSPIAGVKRITYARPSNPWRQLQELALTRFPAMRESQKIVLQLGYLAERYAPLFRILQQRDHQEALADAAAIGLQFLRMMLSIHIWSARLPEAPRPRTIQRLPGRLPGLPDPQVHVRVVDQLEDGTPVSIRLTRYRAATAAPDGRGSLPPILTIHGYSAGGNTFAHPSLRPSLAGFLAARGRDVWVLDLRSSCGMPTACENWTFERIALHDIPAAIDLICAQSGHAQVDVVAHCMGAAMLSMAILSAGRPASEVMSPRETGFVDRFERERDALPKRIRRVLLSQVGPLMVLSQENIFRAYAGSFFERAFGFQTYAFRPEPAQKLSMQLLDRLLATLPYPDDELMRESSADLGQWVDYLGTRHRMDALYGRTFKLTNVAAPVLDHLDDFFGPISLDTVSQVIHFAQHQVITNRAGCNRFVSHERLRDLWTFPTLSIHGEENGLVDVRTLDRMTGVMARAGVDYRTLRLPKRGHQDCLIGEGLEETFATMADFLEGAPVPRAKAEPAYIAEPPWYGPALVVGDDGEVSVSMGAAPALGPPSHACLLAVQAAGSRWQWSATPVIDVWDLSGRAASQTDWFTLPLPAGATPQSRIAVLLLYPQPPEMCRPGFDPSCALNGTVGCEYEARKPPDDASVNWHSGTPKSPAAIVGAVQIALDRMNHHLFEQMGDVPEGVLAIDFDPRASARPRDAQALTIALGSCQFPGGILDQEPAYRAWESLERRFAGTGPDRKPDLLLLAGDQIYADPTAGLFDPRLACDRYQKPYLEWLRKIRVRQITRRIPMATMLDDHEIDDNWEPIDRRRPRHEQDDNVERHRDGVAAFRRYQRPDAPARPLWFDFNWNGFPIFMLDSRSERDQRKAGAADPEHILSSAQRAAIEMWLDERTAAPKIIVAPALLLPAHLRALPRGDRTSHLRSDGWDGYPESLRWLLAAIAGASDPVLLLSGDEHRALFTEIDVRSRRGERKIYSIHSPGLYTPYLFANAYPGDFRREDAFAFNHAGVDYDCRYRIEPPASVQHTAGFTEIDLQKEGAGWRLRCRFPNGFSIQRMLE